MLLNTGWEISTKLKFKNKNNFKVSPKLVIIK